MPEMMSLANHFLIAMPALDDPNFFHSVTYLCEHNEDGAMGIVINRPLDIQLGEVFVHMNLTPKHQTIGQYPVFLGGPVQRERGFVIHCPIGQWESQLRVNNEIAVTTSKDILAAIADGNGPEQMIIALGYAGWGPGQLEQELTQNTWLIGPADPEVIFHVPPPQRWAAAAKLVGVDLNRLSDAVGHA